jgi:hypothetical protein
MDPRTMATVLAARIQRPAFLDIASLAFCLMGLIGLIAVTYQLKTVVRAPGTEGVPRALFVLFLAMACSPFLVALVKPPKLPFLVPPVVAILLMYPISAPFGIVYSADPIFNFTFTREVLDSGFWAPGTGTAFAQTYSFYPLGNVFVAYVIQTVSAPAAAAVFPWIQSILRLLAGPAAVYAVGRRLFGIRIAAMSVLFYLATPSILFNSPVQQGMGIIFVDLSLLALVILIQHRERLAQRRTQVLFAFVASGIVLSHHLSSYVFAAWLAVLAILMLLPRFRPVGSGVRLTTLFFYFIGLLNLYIVAFTFPIFLRHETTFEAVIARLIAPEDVPGRPGGGGGLGRTFSTLEIAWLGGSILGLVLLALIGVRRYRRVREQPFAVANGLVTVVLVLAALPLLATPLSFIALRITEFTGIFVAPFAATTLIRWSRTGLFRISRISPASQETRMLPRALALVLGGAIFMGGALVPSVNMRHYFEPPEVRNTESPLYFGSDLLRAAEWARIHLHRGRVWGDQLSIDAFGGFADMETDFGSSSLFLPAMLTASTWIELNCSLRLRVGDVIVVNRWMLEARPNFFHEPALSAPLTRPQIEKFDADPHLARIYQDGTVSIFRIITPVGPPCG